MQIFLLHDEYNIKQKPFMTSILDINERVNCEKKWEIKIVRVE